MRFSLFHNCGDFPGKEVSKLYREIEEQAIVADRLGFDAIWLAEHHFEAYSSMPSPLLYLARISSFTRSIELGVAVIEAPYYHPLRLAEDIALLDMASMKLFARSITRTCNTRMHCAQSLYLERKYSPTSNSAIRWQPFWNERIEDRTYLRSNLSIA